MIRRAAIVVAALAPLLGGCFANVGTWSDTGFAHDKHGWKVAYSSGEDVLGSNWRLDNWKKQSDGRWERQPDAELVDLNRNGIIDQNEYREYYLHALKFTNVRNNGVIWIDSEVLGEADVGKDLQVLLENYVSINTNTPASWRYQLDAELASRGDVELSHHAAVSGVVELKPRRQPGDEEKKLQFRKVHLVLVKFDFLGEAESLPSSEVGSVGMQATKPGGPIRQERHTGMLVVGYANDSERFDASLPDFAKLLAQISLPDPLPPEAPAAGKGKGTRMTGKAKAPAGPAAPPAPAQKAPPAAKPADGPAKPPRDPDQPTVEI